MLVQGYIEGKTEEKKAPSEIKMHITKETTIILLLEELFSILFNTSLTTLTSLTSEAEIMQESLALIIRWDLSGRHVASDDDCEI